MRSLGEVQRRTLTAAGRLKVGPEGAHTSLEPADHPADNILPHLRKVSLSINLRPWHTVPLVFQDLYPFVAPVMKRLGMPYEEALRL